jgi:hypothetical protein
MAETAKERRQCKRESDGNFQMILKAKKNSFYRTKMSIPFNKREP